MADEVLTREHHQIGQRQARVVGALSPPRLCLRAAEGDPLARVSGTGVAAGKLL